MTMAAGWGGQSRDEFQSRASQAFIHDCAKSPAESSNPAPILDRVSPQHNPAAPIMARSVSWWSVHEFVAPVLERVGSWPMAGSVEWCELPPDHPARIAALFDAARHHALRVETCQEQLAEASKAISGAEDWSEVADEIQQRRDAYIRREAS